jgi:hypothetical protein
MLNWLVHHETSRLYRVKQQEQQQQQQPIPPWVDGGIFKNRYHKNFVPKVWYFLKGQVGIQRVGFLLNQQKYSKIIRNKKCIS